MAYDKNNTKFTSYVANGTWTIDPRTSIVEFYVWGGGGGSGRCGISAAAGGGAGGGGGTFIYFKSQAAVLTSSPYTVTIGTGGAGGISINAVTTNGNPGIQGNNTSVGTVVVASGGGGGGGGIIGSSTGGRGGVYTIGFSEIVYYLAGSGATGTAILATNYPFAPVSGGGGGIGYNTAQPLVGAVGSSIIDFASNVLVAGGLGGANTGATAGNGNSPSSLSFLLGGTGGGGGGHDGTTIAGTGGNGAQPGGGGGGGAGNLNSNASGAGGNGGTGQVYEEESKWNYKMMRKYLKWYYETEPQIFNETIPFGSHAHWDGVVFKYQDTESLFTLPDSVKQEKK